MCIRDRPYDYDLTSKLIELASTHQLQYAIDIYPYYSSDVSAALRGCLLYTSHTYICCICKNN